MRKFLLVIVCLHTLCSIAQTPFVDSVRKELGKQKPDSMKVHDRIRVSWTLIRMPDSVQVAWRMLDEIDSLAYGSKNPVLIGLALEHRGYYHALSHSKKAIEYYLESESILKKYPQSTAAIKSMITVQLGIAYELMLVHNYEEALNYNLSSMRRAEAFDMKHRDLGVLYGNIVNCYYNLHKYEAALSYCDKAYNQSKQAGPPVALFSACGNYGQTLYKLSRKEEALKYLDEAKAVALSLNDPYMLAKYYMIVGTLEYENKEYKASYSNFLKAVGPVRNLQSPYELNEVYVWLGAAAMRNEDYTLARRYQDTALKIASDYQFNQLRRDVYDQKYLTERGDGNADQAFIFLDSSIYWRDSLQQKENVEKAEFLDARYQAEKKEAQIGRLTAEKEVQALNLRQKNILNYVLAGGAVAVLLISLLFYRNYRHKQKLQQQRITELETQQQLTATEAVLKGEEQERTRLAKDLHDGLGGMLSSVKYSLNTMKGNLIMTPENAQAFERSIDMLDSSIKEMRRVAHNMMPEALVKFGLDTALKDFCNDVNQSGVLKVHYESIGMEDASIGQTTAITIYRIVQELLNNSIKHAVAKNAIVQLSRVNNSLSVTVEDDGKGFDTSILQSVRGIGWSNIKNRVEFLKGKMDVNSRTGEGTSVLIELPY
ncbi:MAG: sensor histidine kinase [Ferruginibacter sp.]